MKICIVTFDGFNELDSLVAFGILNIAINYYIKKPEWSVSISSPTKMITSMNGILMESGSTLQDACEADVVIIGSGMKTRDIVNDNTIMSQLKFDPSRQLIVSQCSGALILAKLGLLNNIPACTDLTTKPYVEEAGIKVLDQSFFASGNIATAGGCLSSQYIVAWILARIDSIESARNAIYYAAPVGEKDEYVERAMKNITPFL